MKAVILCGGHALRLHGNLDATPKPLITVHGQPILAHIIAHYQRYGVSSFILLVGHHEAAFRAFASSGSVPGADIQVLQTGAETPTGARIAQAAVMLDEDDQVLVTYGDGIADVDIAALCARHRDSGKAVTLTAVQPRLPFGLLELGPRGDVQSFVEKPRMTQRTNGGFFVLNREVLATLGHDTDFEHQTLPELAAQGRLGAYLHDGFWKSLDTYKDYVELDSSPLPFEQGRPDSSA
ncbi:sugar phosphate nucleotidyltransferase [Alcanivorax quisquiliarum]|uniref:Sugar phosphate nucleotidyltransferase n=1 Tax=Alcanivorax quisquiliarum TaxID=2933565 RepID=A0ABT0E3K1_9GAMM|nr:sugar phosphate nucleotidyltransferase [Alcanivorax quisquiliarum]MCK0536385.1 sugar phosphate nucleotidyltransferase [Alcanivorax quisquiliarum]